MKVSLRWSLVILGAVAALTARPLAVSAGPTPGPSMPPEQMKLAEDYWSRGAAAYSNGDYQTAITLWNQSYDISHEPKLQQQLALAYGHLGKAKEERAALQAWRPAAPAAEQPRIDAQIKNLDERIAQQDKDEKARADEAARLKDKLAYEEAHRQAPVSGFSISIPGVVVGSVGVAAIIAGVAVDGAAAGTRPDASKVCKTSGTSQICLASAKDGIQKGNTMAIAGDATWIVGAAAVAAGVVIIVVDRPHAAVASPAPASPPARDHAGASPRAGRVEIELGPLVVEGAYGTSAPGVACGGRF